MMKIRWLQLWKWSHVQYVTVSLQSLLLGYFVGLEKDASMFKMQDSSGRLWAQQNTTICVSVKQECCSFPCLHQGKCSRIFTGADSAYVAGVGYSGGIHHNAVGQGAFVSPALCL